VIPYAQVFQISATHTKAHFPLVLVPYSLLSLVTLQFKSLA